MNTELSVDDGRTTLSPAEPTCANDDARLAALEEYRLVPLGELTEAKISTQIVCDLEGLAELAARIADSQAAVFNIISGKQQHQVAAWNIAPQCAIGTTRCAPWPSRKAN